MKVVFTFFSNFSLTAVRIGLKVVPIDSFRQVTSRNVKTMTQKCSCWTENRICRQREFFIACAALVYLYFYPWRKVFSFAELFPNVMPYVSSCLLGGLVVVQLIGWTAFGHLCFLITLCISVLTLKNQADFGNRISTGSLVTATCFSYMIFW